MEFAFTSVLIQPTRVTDFTDNVEAIGAGIEKLGRRGTVQGGNQLMEAIMGAMEDIAAPGKRPVLIVLRIGNEGTSPISANTVREALRRTGTTLYVVSRAGASKAAPTYSAGSSTHDRRSRAAADGRRGAGGHGAQLEPRAGRRFARVRGLPAGNRPDDDGRHARATRQPDQEPVRDHLHAARRRQTERSAAGHSEAQGRDAARPGEDSQLTVEVPVEGLASPSKGVSMSSVRTKISGAGLCRTAGRCRLLRWCTGVGGEEPARDRRAQGHRPDARPAERHRAERARAWRAGRERHAADGDDRARRGGAARLGTRRAARTARDAGRRRRYPEQTLAEELILIGRDGSATIEFDGKTAELAKDSVLYLQPGAKRSLKAGPGGWKAFEVYSPIRLDHLALAGQNTSGVNATFPDQGVTPSIPAGVVVNFNDIQWTPVTNPDATKPYKRSTGHSRLIWGKNAQISFVRMDPGGEFPLHIHPEDQLTHTVRGTADQGVMDATYPVSGQAANMLFLPGDMVHSAKLGPHGADQLDVFWPVRPDYIERAQKLQAAYEARSSRRRPNPRSSPTGSRSPKGRRGSRASSTSRTCSSRIPPRATGPAARPRAG